MHISERDLQLPDLEFPKIQERIVKDKSIISLGPGEPDFITPKPLLDYGRKLLSKGEGTHYSEPRGLLELREAIVRKLKKENKINTSSDSVLVTCGSQEALFSSLLTTIDPTEEVVLPSPGYLGYLPAIELVNGVPKFLELKESEGFEVNPDRLRRIIDKKKTKAIILNSPSNPTGNVLSHKILEEIADIAIEKKVYIFSDEAYEKITYDGKKHISIGSLNGMQDNVVTFHTFSKSFAMCGFRLGYCAGPKKLIDEVAKDHHYVTLAAPTLSQMIGVKALNLPSKYVNGMVKEYDRRRKLIVQRLNGMGLETIKPSGAFYTFSNIKNFNKNSIKFSRDLINKAKVAVVPGSEFGIHGEGYIRCSFATRYDLIEKAMTRIERFLKTK